MAPPEIGHQWGPIRRWRLLVVLAMILVLPVACGDGDDAGSSTGEPGAPAGSEAPPTSPAGDSAGGEAGWEVFESAEGRFRVELPTSPTRAEQQVDAQGTPLQLIAFTSTVSETKLYNVAYVDYPEIVKAADPAETLDGVVDGAAAQAKGTVTARASLTAAGFPAVDYTIEVEEGEIRARAILAETRLYLLQQAGDVPDRPGFERMTGSFELLPA